MLSAVLNSTDLTFYEAFGPWEVGGGGDVVNVMVLQELCELIRSKWWAIVHIEQEWWPILRDRLVQAHTMTDTLG